ncbi:MAG: gamma-glutamyltransferase, partial [Thiohalorhabdaceae bacterium]
AENLAGLVAAVDAHGADLGVANDGDADRLALVTPDRGFLDENRFFAAVYDALLETRSGPAVRSVATTFLVDRVAEAHGERVVETPVGFKWVAEAMVEHDGLVGGEANAIAPGKRPLSSMSPTFVEGPEATLLVGTPGGSRIITMVARAVTGMIWDEGGADALRHWVTRPRYHHQYRPDAVQHEPDTFTEAEREALAERGHAFEAVGRQFGDMQAILWQHRTGDLKAVADPRGEGEGVVSEE